MKNIAATLAIITATAIATLLVKGKIDKERIEFSSELEKSLEEGFASLKL